jgi:hypothetical protein
MAKGKTSKQEPKAKVVVCEEYCCIYTASDPGGPWTQLEGFGCPSGCNCIGPEQTAKANNGKPNFKKLPHSCAKVVRTKGKNRGDDVYFAFFPCEQIGVKDADCGCGK